MLHDSYWSIEKAFKSTRIACKVPKHARNIKWAAGSWMKDEIIELELQIDSTYKILTSLFAFANLTNDTRVSNERIAYERSSSLLKLLP